MEWCKGAKTIRNLLLSEVAGCIALAGERGVLEEYVESDVWTEVRQE